MTHVIMNAASLVSAGVLVLIGPFVIEDEYGYMKLLAIVCVALLVVYWTSLAIFGL